MKPRRSWRPRADADLLQDDANLLIVATCRHEADLLRGLVAHQALPDDVDLLLIVHDGDCLANGHHGKVLTDWFFI